MKFHFRLSVQSRAAARQHLLGRLSVSGVVTALALGCLPARGSDHAVAVAIKDARIVTVSGSPIAKGTIVWRDGIIQAVGENVAIPADARIVDGTGLTVYPGLIDASTSLGLPAAPQPQGRVRGGGGPPAAAQPGEQVSSALDPSVDVAEQIKPGGPAIESERNAGVTTALTANSSGLFRGKSALINLAGEETPAMLVKKAAALHVGFQGSRTGGYPGSLMGVLAYFRQSILDAQHYKAEWEHFESHKRGTRRPEPSAALDALQPVIEGKMPVVFHVNSVNDMKRAIGLGEEFHLKYVIDGGIDAWEIAPLLKSKNVPVLVSVNFPKAPADADPDADVALRVLKERSAAPKNAGALAKAGVKFALTSGGMQNTADFMPNIRKAIENGLSEEAALRAMTLSPAEILGVADQLGSLETGKIANLVVTNGALFSKDSKIKHLFIDGEEVEVKQPPEKPAGGESAPSVNVAGKWELTVISPQGQIVVTADLTQSGATITGSTSSQFGTAQISNGSLSGNKLAFTISFDAGGQQITATFTGTVTGDSISGTVTASGQGSFEFSGRRTP